MTDHGDSEDRDLLEAVRLARRELKLSRRRQESAVEDLQRARRQRAELRDQVELFSQSLARILSERYWADQRALTRRLRPRRDEEADQVAAVEASDLFDGAWYLRQRPDAVAALLSPAVHYLRVGAQDGAEPGPRFDTPGYLRDHPAAQKSGLAPLLHYVRRPAP